MRLHEALAERSRKEPYLTRAKWLYVTDHPATCAVKLNPTNSPDGCIVISETKEALRGGW